MKFLHDMRASLRLLARSPVTSGLALLTLALGIGASTAIFSVTRGVLLKPLPYPDPDRLAMIWESKPEAELPQEPVAASDYKDWRDGSQAFEHLVAIRESRFNMTGGEEPAIVAGSLASGEFFQMLGIKPLLGRTFGPDDDRPGVGGVAVLGYDLWHSRFGGDTGVLGRRVTLDGTTYTIIGVMPAGFELPRESQVWVPLALDFASAPRGAHELMVMGRLRRGATLDQARAELSGVASRLALEYPGTNQGWGVRVASLQDSIVANIRPALVVLLVAVGFVLLIACANVANLLLSRVVERERELAVRTALGAGKGDLMRQMIAESMTLFLLGGIGGLLVAFWGTRLLIGLNPDAIPRAQEITLDPLVLAFTLAVSLVTGLVVGLVPALNTLGGGRLYQTLREGGRSLAGGMRGRSLRNLLVSAEVAVALILLIGAALLIQSFSRLRSVDPGFSPQGVLTAQLSLPPAKYEEPTRQTAFYQEMLGRVSALPGIERAASVFPMPFDPNQMLLIFRVEGRPIPAPDERVAANVKVVSPDYFSTLGIPVLEGRAFTPQDNEQGQRVVIINRKLAQQIWPGEMALGKRITFDGPAPDARFLTVVGIVGETRSSALDQEPVMEAYWPLYQVPIGIARVVVKSAGDPARQVRPVQSAIHAVDRDVPVDKVRTLEDVVNDSLAQSRFKSALLGLFASLALVLAAVGIYGVISYSVVRRTHEIGVRMALGADRQRVLWLMVVSGMKLVASGLVVGLVVAYFGTRLLSDQVYGVTTGDPLTYVAMPLILALVAFLANYLPARRATRVEPLEALRSE
ncbi:MAG TPA: ABC transporter permease [Thermoanaerobaculia bacterium]|nr:ABC transporter permease [Thermoanaerobaculia bacterium]